MVFESLVADLLNRFLGDFVENLDSSQLNVGIWGGDVRLEDLEVKETALDDFDLPIKLKFGYLSSLVLKIPWKNLYTEPVIADIDGLHLIIVPNKGVVYNEDKAKKNATEVKQKTLARLEEARKNRRKPQDPVQDTFTEKMITQIIKNLQVSIKNIHVRFEDKWTNRHRPFCAGVTLENLVFQTTDENWLPTIRKETVKIIHKLISLENLAVYWNSSAELLSDLEDRDEIKDKMLATITTKSKRPDGYKYILEPIKMEAKLQLNQKPETDGSGWTIPKIDLSVDMEALALKIGKFQYQDILLFLEAQERFTLAGQYLKYRPKKINEYRGHYRQWWHFAYTCILEEKVRRRRRNWNWERMKRHRHLVRDYRDAWVKHQTEKSLPGSVVELIKKAEDTLDVFNVNVARQQAEMEIDRKGLTRVEDQPQGIMGWAKTWWSSGSKDDQKKKQDKDIVTQFEEAMTPEEKSKLFEAIDYQENIPPTNYPKEYVENKMTFRLGEVAIAIDGAIMMKLHELNAFIQQRPSAGAINIKSGIKELRMDGGDAEMLRVRDPSKPWLDLEIDTNPLHGKYDQKVRLNIAPVSLKYHAPAVNTAIEVFKPPESVRLTQLTAAAMSRYEDVKTRSMTGLAHAVEFRKKLVLDISINPATLMISEGGIYAPEKPTIVADLGVLSITTVESNVVDSAGQDRMKQLREQAYDKFRVKLSNVVIAFAETMEKATMSLPLKESPLHILKPTGLDIQLHKSSIDDLSLPRIRIVGDLPNVVVVISDQRLLMLMRLLNSIPKPKPEETPEILEELPLIKNEVKIKDRAKMKTIMEADEVETSDVAQQKGKEEAKNEQQVQVELDLKLETIGVTIYKGEDVLMDVRLQRFVCQLQMRTFDLIVKAELGSISVAMPKFRPLDDRNPHLFLVNSFEEEGALMEVKFVQANPESPYFATEYNKTEMAVVFKFSRLNLGLHQQAFLEVKKFGEALQEEMEKEKPEETQKDGVAEEETLEATGRKLSRKISSSMESLAQLTREAQQEAAQRKRARRKKKANQNEETPDPHIIKMKIDASIGQLAILMGTEKEIDTFMAIEKVNSEVRMMDKTMEVKATLQAIKIQDMTKGALYRDLMAVHGNEDMLRFEFTQYQRTDVEKKAMSPTDIDMKVKLRLAQMRFVFLQLWVNRMQMFVAPFGAETAKVQAHAQAVAAEKSHEALEAAKQMLEQSPPRIELDVELLAPLILVPRLSTSTHVLVVDLGNLVVQNRILGDHQLKKAVLDSMNIKLTDVYFGIGHMDDAAENLVSKCEILKPITFSLDVHRNLTFSIVKDIPEIAVNAHLTAINCSLSHDDYVTMMQTLSGNLNEGKELVEENVAPVVAPAVTLEKKEERMAGGVDEKTQAKTKSDDSDALKIKTYKRIIFKFVLDNIAVELFTGLTMSSVRDLSNALASMRIEGLKLSGHIKEDNELEVAMSLDTFKMSDERKGKTKIPQLLDKKSTSKEERFLDLSFKQTASQDKNVRLEMSAFFLCMCPEFLGCLAAFFNVPQTQEELERESRITAIKASSHPQAEKTVQEQQPPTPGAITMDCDLKGVEVIIVENSMDPDNTQALILSFNAKLKAEPRQYEQVMHGGVEAFRVFSSYYAPHKRKDVTYEVLKSVDIGIAARINNETKATDVMLKMTALELKMAPSVIRLLAAANAEFARSNQADQNAVNVTPRRKAYPGYWSKRAIEEHKFWFFNVPEMAQEIGEDYDEDEERRETHLPPTLVENCIVEIPRLSFTLEAGNEAIPLPLIFFDMQVKADAHNWSSALKANAELSVQMSYYNEGCSVWEPVIEPVEDLEKPNEWERWSLRVSAEGRNKLDKDDNRAGMNVKVEADKMLNLTVTKSFIQLLTRLGEVFASAAKQTSPPISRQLPGLSNFLIYNDTGMTIRVANSTTLKASDNGASVDATHGAYVDLDAISSQAEDKKKRENAENFLSIIQEEIKADLRLEILDTIREVVVGRADKWMLPLPKQSDGGKQWKILVDVAIENSRRVITLRSHVQIANNLDIDMEIYSRRDNSLDLAAVVPSNGVVNLPTPLLFTPTGELFFKPVGDKTEVSFEAVSWHDFEHQKRAPIRCNLSEDDKQGYFFETVVEQENVHLPSHGDISSDMQCMDACFKLSLYPPLVFHNNLPFPVHIEKPLSLELPPGNDAILNTIAGQTLRLRTKYLDEDYILDMRIEEKHEDLQVVALNTESGSAELLLGLHWSMEYGGLKAYLYAPFWLVNNTSLTLQHMESTGGFMASTSKCIPCRTKRNSRGNEPFALTHAPGQNPIILPFPSKNIEAKKKAKVQIAGSSTWSEEFPLETVGNTARVICKGSSRDYELSVSIQLCQSGLTNIVSFAPFYLVSNCGKFDLEIREDSFSEWVKILAETCVGVWPSQRSQRKHYCARFVGSDEESLLFPITENIETLAQINDDSAGIDVACRVGESSVTVHLTPFTPGSAPVHVINHLKIPIHYGQKGHSKSILGPKEHIFFTWSDLTRDRIMEYQIGDFKSETTLEQNEFGEAQPRKDLRKFIYHASFLNGRQRTLLFTADAHISRVAFGDHLFETPEFSFELLLQGIGLSVVDNEKGMEVVFVGISSSDILWEEEVRSSSIFRSKRIERYKPLPVKYMQRLEDKYQLYLQTKQADWEDLEKYEFNLKHMLLRRKKNGREFKLRRTFERGLWGHYTTTALRKRLHFKLNHLQVDNQMDACVFPCVLSIVPPPKSVIQDNAPKPFIEISFVERLSEFSTIPEVEYCKVLVQEFAVRVDQGLINAGMALSPNAAAKKPYGKTMFDEDLESTKVNLSEMADAWKSQKPKSYYNDFHISPLMIHLSFSQGGTTAEQANAPAPIQSEFVKVLLKSVGVTLTELQDVVFKLAYFERKAVFYNMDQLNAEIVSHYTMQGIKQLYVLVFGLDIIGNPFGLVRDLSTGVEDLFYQPYQGLIQGPEEFVSGVAIGVQSMFGHAVGGAAGAVGRITGTVGKGVAALTFDQEYQRKRQEDLNRRPQSFAEGMARGFKGLGMGVVDGVKGVVTKPIEGAKQDGFGGFIKGTGKGLVGLAARPISGVVDFASSSMDAVRSVAGTHKDTGAIRPPRYIKPDHIVRPYSPNLAMGFRIFKDTDRGAFTETDYYICYAPISERVALLVTNRQMIIAKRTDVMGTWTADWTAEFAKIHPPQYVAEGVKIRLLEKKRGFLGIGGSEGKIITFQDAQVRRGLEGIQQAIMKAYENATRK